MGGVFVRSIDEDFVMELSHPNDKNINVVRVGHPDWSGCSGSNF
jgi:hypothetical protein